MITYFQLLEFLLQQRCQRTRARLLSLLPPAGHWSHYISASAPKLHFTQNSLYWPNVCKHTFFFCFNPRNGKILHLYAIWMFFFLHKCLKNTRTQNIEQLFICLVWIKTSVCPCEDLYNTIYSGKQQNATKIAIRILPEARQQNNVNPVKRYIRPVSNSLIYKVKLHHCIRPENWHHHASPISAAQHQHLRLRISHHALCWEITAVANQSAFD